MNIDVLFSVEVLHKATNRRYTFGAKASDIRSAVNAIFHPDGFKLEWPDHDSPPTAAIKLNREHYTVLKVVQREG